MATKVVIFDGGVIATKTLIELLRKESVKVFIPLTENSDVLVNNIHPILKRLAENTWIHPIITVEEGFSAAFYGAYDQFTTPMRQLNNYLEYRAELDETERGLNEDVLHAFAFSGGDSDCDYFKRILSDHATDSVINLRRLSACAYDDTAEFSHRPLIASPESLTENYDGIAKYDPNIADLARGVDELRELGTFPKRISAKVTKLNTKRTSR